MIMYKLFLCGLLQKIQVQLLWVREGLERSGRPGLSSSGFALA